MSESDEEQTQGRIRSNTNPSVQTQNNRVGVSIPVTGDRTHVQRIKVTHGDNNAVINSGKY